MGLYNSKQFAINRISFLKSIFLMLFALIILLPANLLAESKGSIKGTIIDAENKKPLAGASVSIPALRIGAITDDKGKFSFDVPAGTHTVQVKFIGYETVSRKVVVKSGESTKLDMDLSTNDIKTSEVVVVGLTGEVDRNKLGNVISSVGGKDVSKAVTTSAIDVISGRVPGVQVTKNSGTPGAGTFITMRGRRTIEGSSEPLYVVDGIIMDNSSLYDGSGTQQYSNRAVDINPQDIESIEILKGASAAAIYGSQAGNGVVIITTKRGKMSSYDKPASISFSTNWGIDEKSGNIPLQTKYGQTTPYAPGKPGSTTSYGKELPAGTPVFKQDEAPFRTGNNQLHSLTISGGVPQFDYLLNGSFEDITGYVIGSDYTRTNFRGNIGAQLLPGLTIQNNMNFIGINNNLPQDGSNTSGILLGALRTPPEFDNSIYLESDGSQRRFASYDNPLWTQHFNTYNSKIDRFLNSTELKYKPVDWITFKAGLGIDRYEYLNKERLAVGSASSPSRGGSISESRYTSKSSNLDLTATFVNKFADDMIATTLVVGSQSIWTSYSSLGGSSTNTLPFYDMISAGSTKDAGSGVTETQRIGLFGQLTTSFLERYNLTLALRRDGSSTFGESEKFHYYPKAALSYTISDESFFSGLKDVVNSARLRASYGEAGSPSLPYAYATNYLYGTAGFFDPWGRGTTANRNGYIGIKPGGGSSSDAYVVAGAKDINPEKTIEREIGIDFGFLNNMITLEATFYHQNIYDMILSVDVATSTGYDKKLSNAAAMWNEGYEFVLKATPVRSENFTWTTSLNYSRNYNLVTQLNVKPAGMEVTGKEFISLGGGFVGIQNVAMVGKPLGVFRGYGWLRDENGNIQYSTWDAANKEVVGDDWGMNLVGAPIQDPELVVIGNSNPAFQFGWRNEFTIMKDLSLSFLFEGVYGFDIWNGTKGALQNFGTAGNTADRKDPWFNFEGKPVMDYSDPNNPVQAIKEMYYRYYGNGFYINEPFIEDGSFIKLRDITLEYRWDGLKEWNINSITFTASARNLLTITKYTGYDPEVNTFSLAEGRGFDYFTLPQVKSYRFGISINY